jgi:CheY-like chemotaxis protein
MRILIADDNPVDRDTLREALRDRGVEVVEVSTPPDAMAALDGGGIDAAFVDMLMPYCVPDDSEPLNGRDVARKASSLSIRVFAVTSLLFLVPAGIPSVMKGEPGFRNLVRRAAGLPMNTPTRGVERLAL